jgi:hypothetical protein
LNIPRYIPVLTVLLVFLCTLTASASEEFIERIATEWYEKWFLGERCGYANDYVNLVRFDGREAWKIYRREVARRQGSYGQLETIVENLDYLSRDFTVIRSVHKIDDCGQIRITEVNVTGNTAHVEVTLDGKSISYDVQIVPGTVLVPSGFQFWKMGYIVAGTSLSIPVLVPERRAVFHEKYVFGEEKKIKTFDDKTVTIVPASSTRPDLPGLVSYTEYGFDGTEYRSIVGRTEIWRTSRNLAFAPLYEGRAVVEIDVSAARNDFLNITDFTELFIEVKVEDVENAAILFEPHVGSEFVNGSVVKLSGLFILETDLGQVPDDVRIFLEPSLKIQSDEPAITEAAKRIVGTESLPPAVIADRIIEWLDRSLKREDTGPKTAAAVFGNMSGYCNEFSYLFVALCRASGVPARSVTGLIFENGKMFYHQWAEIYSDGEWILCDPTRWYVTIPPIYLAVGTDPEDRPGIDPVYQRATLQGQTSIRVLSGTLVSGEEIDFTKSRRNDEKYPPQPKRKERDYEPYPEGKNTIYPPMARPRRRKYDIITSAERLWKELQTHPEQRNYPRIPRPMLPSRRLRKTDNKE